MNDEEDFHLMQPIIVLVEGDDSTTLRNHKSNSRKLQCQLCGLSFTTKSQFNLHNVRVHSNSNVFKTKTKLSCCRYFDKSRTNTTLHEQSQPSRRLYKCFVCDKRFFFLTALKKHEIWHNSKHPFRCRLCHLCFHVKVLLLHHLNTVHLQNKLLTWQDKPHMCEFCGKGFLLESSLQTHHKLHRGFFKTSCCPGSMVRGLHCCSSCSRRFKTQTGLKRHFSQIHGISQKKKITYPCEICGHRFATKVQLRKHSTIHSGERPYICDLCGKGFRLASYLSGHKFLHTGQRPFQCQICNRRFAGRKTLQNHMMIHTGERPFSCELCPKAFNRAETLRMHQRSHTGEQPYQCLVCQKRYRYLSKLRAHQKQHFKVKEDLRNERELLSILP